MNLLIVIADDDLELLTQVASREGCNTEAWCSDALASMVELIRLEQRIGGALDQIISLEPSPGGLVL